MDVKEEMRQLVDKLNEYSYQYYTLDNPTVADVEYDRLYDRLVALEKESGIVLENSPTKRVGDVVLKGFKSVKHLGRLYSLDKCQTKEALGQWLDKLIKALGKMPACSLEYKFDGLTINMLYENGFLVCDGACTQKELMLRTIVNKCMNDFVPEVFARGEWGVDLTRFGFEREGEIFRSSWEKLRLPHDCGN